LRLGPLPQGRKDIIRHFANLERTTHERDVSMQNACTRPRLLAALATGFPGQRSAMIARVFTRLRALARDRLRPLVLPSTIGCVPTTPQPFVATGTPAARGVTRPFLLDRDSHPRVAVPNVRSSPAPRFPWTPSWGHDAPARRCPCLAADVPATTSPRLPRAIA